MKRPLIATFLFFASGVTAQTPVRESIVIDNPAYTWLVEITSTGVTVRDKTNPGTYTFMTGGQVGTVFNGGESYATLDSSGLLTLQGPAAAIWINGQKRMQ